MMWTALLLSRVQFAFTVSFHAMSIVNATVFQASVRLPALSYDYLFENM
jgi:hypothetical protein